MRRRPILLAGLLALCLSLLAGACSRDATDGTVTTRPLGVAPSGGEATTSTAAEGAGEDDSDATTTTVASAGVPDYEIRFRSPGEGGETLVALIEPAAYSDLDLEGLIGDILEDALAGDEGAVWEIHVVDDAAAVNVVTKADADLTAEDRALLAEHYLVRLQEGTVLVFEGPYSALGQHVIGS